MAISNIHQTRVVKYNRGERTITIQFGGRERMPDFRKGEVVFCAVKQPLDKPKISVTSISV